MLFDTDAGFTHGPIHIVIAVLISFNLIFKQIAIEGLKTRLALAQKLQLKQRQNKANNDMFLDRLAHFDVGDGDLSFSHAIARHIKPTKLVSTYDDANTIEQKYADNAQCIAATKCNYTH